MSHLTTKGESFTRKLKWSISNPIYFLYFLLLTIHIMEIQNIWKDHRVIELNAYCSNVSALYNLENLARKKPQNLYELLYKVSRYRFSSLKTFHLFIIYRMWNKLFKSNRKLRRWLTGSSDSLNTTHMQIHHIFTKVLHNRSKDRHTNTPGRGSVNGMYFSGRSQCL